MHIEEIERRVRQVLELVLGGEIAQGDVSRENEPRWDSIKNIEFAFLLEDEFGLELSENDLADFVRLSDVTRVIEVHLAA